MTIQPLHLEERSVASSLGRLRLRVAGQGPVILFWPSLLMDGGMWLAQAQHFADRYRVVLIDSPGHGGSEPLTRLFDFAECAQCVVQILDAVGAERGSLVGNSWGGMIGGTVAALHPQRIDRIVLMNATASRAGLRQRLEYSALCEIVRLLGGFRGPFIERAVGAFVGQTTARERPEVAAQIRAAVSRVDAASVYWAVRSVVPRRPDQHALFGRIRARTLVVAGEEDPTFPVAETRAMADAIPGARFVVMPRTGHLAALERPADVNRLIDAFFSE